MAARGWRERQVRGVCRDCGRKIEPKRKALGMRCCQECGKNRADAEHERRLRHTIGGMTPTDQTAPTPSTPTPPPAEHILQFFAYEQLPPHLQAVSRPFCELARIIVADGEIPAGTPTQFPLPRNPERTVALRKLLEAKDAAVRALGADGGWKR